MPFAIGALLYGADEMVTEWVRERIPTMDGRSFGPCSAIGILRDGQLVGGAVFNQFHQHDDGGDIMGNMAVLPGCKFTPQILRGLFAYPFVQLGCARLTMVTTRSNKAARAFNVRTGGRLEGVIRRGFGRQDLMLYGMLRAECRFLPKGL